MYKYMITRTILLLNGECFYQPKSFGIFILGAGHIIFRSFIQYTVIIVPNSSNSQCQKKHLNYVTIIHVYQLFYPLFWVFSIADERWWPFRVKEGSVYVLEYARSSLPKGEIRFAENYHSIRSSELPWTSNSGLMKQTFF